VKYIKGDLIKLAKEWRFDVIVHGCNCLHTMGAGIAAQIAKEFPEAYEADKKTEYKSKRKLGTYSFARIPHEHIVTLSLSAERGLTLDPKFLTIVNAYTQYDLGSRYNPAPVDYDAIRSVFRSIAKDFAGLIVGIPKIGCGLAGGDWETVEEIINEECPDLDITCVEYEK
jgi:O-acetyl-ADP-ribose deacetylase (regulator of RNase III)